MFKVLFCQWYLFLVWTLVFVFIIFYCVGEKTTGFTISVHLWSFGFTIMVHSTSLYDIWNVFQVVKCWPRVDLSVDCNCTRNSWRCQNGEKMNLFWRVALQERKLLLLLFCLLPSKWRKRMFEVLKL